MIHSYDFTMSAHQPHIHVLTLSTGELHPLARTKILQVPEQSYIVYDNDMEIAGSRLGVLFSEARYLIVWNLATGEIEAVCSLFDLSTT